MPGERVCKMKWLKYFGSVVCVLMIIGSLPSVYLIASGLISGQVDEPTYFAGKLLAYIVVIVVLALLSVKLFNSAKR